MWVRVITAHLSCAKYIPGSTKSVLFCFVFKLFLKCFSLFNHHKTMKKVLAFIEKKMKLREV